MNGIHDTREYRANETEKTNIGLIREWIQPNKEMEVRQRLVNTSTGETPEMKEKNIKEARTNKNN